MKTNYKQDMRKEEVIVYKLNVSKVHKTYGLAKFNPKSKYEIESQNPMSKINGETSSINPPK